jgi:hypothetical protein
MEHQTEKKIILLHEVIESKVRKEKELEYYTQELIRIQERIGYLSKELDLTKLIIDMIEHEQVKDIKEYMLEQKQ